MKIIRTGCLSAAMLIAAGTLAVSAQDSPSVGRGAPLLETTLQLVGAGGPYGGSAAPAREAAPAVPAVPGQSLAVPARDALPAVPVTQSASNGAVPEGIEALPVDIFTSSNFYADRDLWTDQRYFRCNSSIGLESQWGAYPGTQQINGDNPPATAAWGHCDRDYPREAIVSPYEFDTAKAHYEALMAEATGKGGPTVYTRESPPPDWSGRYARNTEGTPQWIYMHINQMPTILSLLTPEYQTRFVQQAYHAAVNNAPQWPASYCWPEGFMRFFSGPGAPRNDILVTPEQVAFIGGTADNFLRQVQIGRSFKEEGAVPRLGQDVPRWYGETIGFWDGEALITWTSNVQPWMTHVAFEHSNQMQTIEIYTPRHNEAGDYIGLQHETVFYDSEVLVEPVRLVRNMNLLGDLNQGDPYVFVECLQTIFPVDGRAQPLTAASGDDRYVDWFGRPWAQIWDKYFEQDMEKPAAENGLFGF